MNLLDITDLTELQISEIFAWTDRLQSQLDSTLLKRKTFVLFFPESSVRTRISFEKGIKDLGGECIVFPSESLDRREELRDAMPYIQNWADGVIVRHPDFSKIQELSKYTSIPIINAMTSANHPCEILGDLYVISKIRENYRDLTYTFVGPAGNIASSWINVAKVMDLRFNHVCIEGQQLCEENRNYHFHTDLETVLKSSDVILTDSLPNHLRTDEYITNYQITLERMKRTRRHSILNPCPPFFRSEEVSEDVISSDYFVGYAFKKNLIYVHQAVILYCFGIHCL